MPPAHIDQLRPDGTITQAPDTPLSPRDKAQALCSALPGASTTKVAGVSAVQHEDKVLLFKQVTYLGRPWEAFKKRIQIPRTWLEAEAEARRAGLDVRFVGIYKHEAVTIFVDFDPTTYVTRKANNSAAHVMTNDLYQAWTLGVFSREDSRGNRITSVRADLFAEYLTGEHTSEEPAIDVFRRLNSSLLSRGRLEAMPAVEQMAAAAWPDAFQGEWPGFYLEYCTDSFTRTHNLTSWAAFQRNKGRGEPDYDLLLHDRDGAPFFGDLKASSAGRKEAPGNDAAQLLRYVEERGRFWYVVYEHQTWLSRANGNLATIQWNHWRRNHGRWPAGKTFDPLSYSSRFKEAVDFDAMFILEVNPANIGVVLGDFHQGHQPSGAPRAPKVMIRKTNIENFLIFSERRPHT